MSTEQLRPQSILYDLMGRLEGRLSGGSLHTIGPEAAAIAQDSLLGAPSKRG